MPARYLMSWTSTTRRWEKYVKGHRRFVVSCKQLAKHFGTTIPETKEGSYQWANQWWQETASKLALSVPAERHPHADEIARLKPILDWARQHDPKEAAVLAKHLHDVERLSEHEEPDLDPLELEAIRRNREAANLLGLGISDDLHPVAVSHFLGLGRVRGDRIARDLGVAVPQGRTISDLIQRYLDDQLSRHRAVNGTSVSEFSNCRAGLFYFREWAGGDNDIQIITTDKWNFYWRHLIGSDAPKSIDTRRKHFRYARNFLTWLDDMGIHPAPRNLNRRQYRFEGGGKEIATASIEKVIETISVAKGQLRLMLLLMLNCGLTQQDLSDLHPSEVDWERGRIRRKRSKTGEHANVPVVDYPLWTETARLLRQYRSESPTHVLLTESGRTWVRDSVKEGGERSRTDAIQSVYRKLAVEGKPPLKVFRKVGSTTLDGSPEHGKYSIHFLGHVPSDVAHRHYISQNGPGFDAAIKWLGEQFDF